MSKNEVHELLMGVALMALGYALYQHYKKPAVRFVPPSPETIAASDQAAIQTAIDSAPSDLPAIDIPAPIPVTGSASNGYKADTGSWLSNLDNLLQGAL